MNIVELIRKRKWDSLVTWILVVLLGISLPLSVRAVLYDKAGDIVNENLAPIVAEAVSEALKPTIEAVTTIDRRVKNLEDMRISEIIDRGIAAYKKIETVDQLESSTQNAASIKIALRVPEARDILFKIDREKTLLFEEFFFGDTT